MVNQATYDISFMSETEAKKRIDIFFDILDARMDRLWFFGYHLVLSSLSYDSIRFLCISLGFFTQKTSVEPQ
jgi:hypothetical protein